MKIVRYSSVVLLLGIGGYVCYKVIVQRRRRHAKYLSTTPSSSPQPLPISSAESTIEDESPESHQLSVNDDHDNQETNETDATPSLNSTVCEKSIATQVSTSSTCKHSESEGDHDVTASIENYLVQQSFSMTSQSSIIGDGTVAKLDQLLHQIEDLKESVGEMNADLFNVRKIEPKLLSIAGDTSPLGREDNNGENATNKEESQTPSLEWDSNGINLLSDLDSSASPSSFRDSSLKLNSTAKSLGYSPLTPNSTNSSKTTSSNVSLFSSSLSEQETSKGLSAHEFLDNDTKRSSLFTDLRQIVMTNGTNDSSFIEK